MTTKPSLARRASFSLALGREGGNPWPGGARLASNISLLLVRPNEERHTLRLRADPAL